MPWVLTTSAFLEGIEVFCCPQQSPEEYSGVVSKAEFMSLFLAQGQSDYLWVSLLAMLLQSTKLS